MGITFIIKELEFPVTKAEQEAVTRTVNMMVLKILFCVRVVQNAFSERSEM